MPLRQSIWVTADRCGIGSDESEYRLGQEAGIVYVGLTVLIRFEIYTKSKYWNSKYTLGVVVVGLGVWFGIPGVIPLLVPAPFAELGSLAVLVFLIVLVMMLTDKV